MRIKQQPTPYHKVRHRRLTTRVSYSSLKILVDFIPRTPSHYDLCLSRLSFFRGLKTLRYSDAIRPNSRVWWVIHDNPRVRMPEHST